MTLRLLYLAGAAVGLVVLSAINLGYGLTTLSPADIVRTVFQADASSFEQAILLHQRLPRVLIAVYVGATTAVGGVVLQGLVRNPLAAPSTLGINAGATVFVIAGAFLFDLGMSAQGVAALAGAFAGFAACFLVARLAARDRDPRGLALILSGALVSMLCVGLTNALLLSDPTRRNDYLGWVSGNINHAYADRLYAFWWIGAIALAVLMWLARPLTLLLFGAEKAASAGVDVRAVSRLGLAATMFATGSSVAICGPIGFAGLVVPHIVRPLAGSNFVTLLPAAALVGADLCLAADFAAREAFRPYVLHTGLFTDLIGGLFFVAIVKRFYLASPGTVQR